MALTRQFLATSLPGPGCMVGNHDPHHKWKHFETGLEIRSRHHVHYTCAPDLVAAGDHQDDSCVNRSTQRRPTPLWACERSGQSGKQRHIPNRIDRRPDGRKILADFN